VRPVRPSHPDRQPHIYRSIEPCVPRSVGHPAQVGWRRRTTIAMAAHACQTVLRSREPDPGETADSRQLVKPIQKYQVKTLAVWKTCLFDCRGIAAIGAALDESDRRKARLYVLQEQEPRQSRLPASRGGRPAWKPCAARVRSSGSSAPGTPSPLRRSRPCCLSVSTASRFLLRRRYKPTSFGRMVARQLRRTGDLEAHRRTRCPTAPNDPDAVAPNRNCAGKGR
jgi:hypothetical protein